MEVWFTDEARVGQQGTITRMWAKRGSRPRAPRDRRDQWAYLFGAICPQRSTGAAIVIPEVNIAAMNEHLAAISRRVSAGAIAVLVLDGAGWHSSPRLRLPDNIVLLPLPPYAPELNPVENVWEFLRGKPAQPPRLGYLRSHPRGMLSRLEPAHRRAGAHRFHYATRLGQVVRTGHRIGRLVL